MTPEQWKQAEVIKSAIEAVKGEINSINKLADDEADVLELTNTVDTKIDLYYHPELMASTKAALRGHKKVLLNKIVKLEADFTAL
jgi:hypothetical protein